MDSLFFLGDTIKSVVTWLFDHEAGAKSIDATLDFVRTDLVGEANKYHYNTELGKYINEKSMLKYDSAGARAVQTWIEFVGKVAIATAATIGIGGTAAPALLPIILGTAYGSGKTAESYAQSVDRENGEDSNYIEALLRTGTGGVVGAAEFYGYGQIGAGVLGVNNDLNFRVTHKLVTKDEIDG